MELFGEDSKCNRVMGNIPPLSLSGHSVNLLDNYLVIAASGISGEGWWYHSLERARGGLLANPWKHTKTLGNDAPIRHVNFVYGKDLILLGGERGTQVALQNGREENGEWNALRLTLQKDGSNFNKFTQDACVVKSSRETFYLLGGKASSDGPAKASVYKIDMRAQNVEEMGSLLYPRSKHACSIIPSASSANYTDNSLILVTGGETSAPKDEIFDVTQRSSRSLEKNMNLPRFDHRLVNLGQSIFALGGQLQSGNGAPLNDIEVFDSESESWSLHPANLLSTSTDGLAVTEMPSSSVSCNEGCECGVRSGARIVGGAEAQVKSYCFAKKKDFTTLLESWPSFPQTDL